MKAPEQQQKKAEVRKAEKNGGRSKGEKQQNKIKEMRLEMDPGLELQK